MASLNQIVYINMTDFYDNPEAFFRVMGEANGGLPMPSSFPSPESVRSQAKVLSSDIFTNWVNLRGVIERREVALRKRWMKKTQEARRATLLKVTADMPTMHRPDWWAMAHPASKTQNPERYLNSLRFPYLNLEDLQQARPLLLMLNSRGRNPPSAFAHADLHALHIGVIKGEIDRVFLNQYTMYLAGESGRTNYGRLVSWDEEDEAFDLMHTGLQFNPGEGVVVLEAQKWLYDFLMKCCLQVFIDVSTEELVGSNYPILEEPAPLLARETAYPQLSAITAEATYRLPAQLDMHSLVHLVEARRAAAEDHIWDLREDPAYFAASVLELREHRHETMTDTTGRRHPHLDDDVFWDRVLGNIIIIAYKTFLTWDHLYNRIVEVANALPAQPLDQRAALPEHLERAFLDLRHTLGKTIQLSINELKETVPGCPQMRPFWERQPQQPGTTIMTVGMKKAPTPGSIMSLFFYLWDDQQRFLLGLPNVIDEMQRFLDHDTTERSKLRALVLATFSDLSLMAQISHQVEIFFPWAAGFENREVGFESPTYEKEIADFTYIRKNLETMPSCAKLGDPTGQRFYYPVEKKRNESNINAMRNAEANLDDFWRKVDRHFWGHEQTLQNILVKHGAHLRSIQRLPPFSPPESSLPSRPAPPSAAESLDGVLREIDINSSESGIQPGRYVPETPRIKSKTRGAPGKTSHEDPEQVTAEGFAQTDAEHPIYKVGKRAHKVFKTLFPVPRAEQPGSEVSWNDFLHSMGSIGCTIQKLYGSIWQFEPPATQADNWHGIHFHEPHPSGKISLSAARPIGRRLFRTYGWTSETFRLE